MRVKISLAALAAAIALPVFAQTDTPGVNRRQARQEARIQQGVQSGALTKREAARAERGQQRIAHMEAAAKGDGQVTNKERARIQHAQNVESRQIRRQKHDRQHR